jgi:hydroxymethylglutaryl-CoA lyase
MAEAVTICEVSPRDGLQNEKAHVSTSDKVRLIDLLSATGLRYIEAASFVSPRWVPQMADGGEVMARITRREGVIYAALVPNQKGYDAALAARADEVAVFAAASETFSQRNINCSVGESLARYRDICRGAARDGVPVRGYVSCAIACPYEGPVKPEAVLNVAAALRDMGCREISLGDTIGVAAPENIAALLDLIVKHIPPAVLAGHFHDTSGRAVACIRESLKYGLRVFDSSVGGAGGCPFAPGAQGNVATEQVAAALEEQDFVTGIDRDALLAASKFISTILGRDP